MKDFGKINKMIIGFTGTQSGRNNFQQKEVFNLFDKYKPTTLHHGDCIGSDAETHFDFMRWHVKNDFVERYIVIHPPVNSNKRAGVMLPYKGTLLFEELNNCKFAIKIFHKEVFPYLERNRHIVEESEIIIATPKEVEHTLRSGTWATIRYAWKLKKKVYVIPPLFAEAAVSPLEGE